MTPRQDGEEIPCSALGSAELLQFSAALTRGVREGDTVAAETRRLRSRAGSATRVTLQQTLPPPGASVCPTLK